MQLWVFTYKLYYRGLCVKFRLCVGALVSCRRRACVVLVAAAVHDKKRSGLHLLDKVDKVGRVARVGRVDRVDRVDRVGRVGRVAIKSQSRSKVAPTLLFCFVRESRKQFCLFDQAFHVRIDQLALRSRYKFNFVLIAIVVLAHKNCCDWVHLTIDRIMLP